MNDLPLKGIQYNVLKINFYTNGKMEWKEENNRLLKTFKLKNFETIIQKLEALSDIADELHHHPDFHVYGYNNIRFELHTHDSNSITNLDYKLAEKIDQIFEN